MQKRLPKPQAILQVYAVIAFLFSAWTIIAFLWKLPAWLLILNLGEIFAVFSYAMLTNLIESLLVLLLLLTACVLLPAYVLRDEFALRGALLAIGLIGTLMVFVRSEMQFGIEIGYKLLFGPLAMLCLTAVFLAFPPRFRVVRFVHSAVLWISDRLTVFLYILVPLFIILAAYIVYRNIL